MLIDFLETYNVPEHLTVGVLLEEFLPQEHRSVFPGQVKRIDFREGIGKFMSQNVPCEHSHVDLVLVSGLSLISFISDPLSMH